jgi:hypothetical protein
MSESRYAIPLEDLVAAARVPEADQVEVQAEPPQPGTGWSADPQPYGDGTGSDVDGD